MLYMVTFTINISPMLAYIYHTWILWAWHFEKANGVAANLLIFTVGFFLIFGVLKRQRQHGNGPDGWSSSYIPNLVMTNSSPWKIDGPNRNRWSTEL